MREGRADDISEVYADMKANKRNEPVFMISLAARLCEMHPQTLRMYERLGLVSPARRNGRNRLYSEEDIARLRQIQRLTQDLGVNLAGVEVILDLLQKLEQVQAEADDRIRAIQAQYSQEIERLRRRLGS